MVWRGRTVKLNFLWQFSRPSRSDEVNAMCKCPRRISLKSRKHASNNWIGFFRLQLIRNFLKNALQFGNRTAFILTASNRDAYKWYPSQTIRLFSFMLMGTVQPKWKALVQVVGLVAVMAHLPQISKQWINFRQYSNDHETIDSQLKIDCLRLCVI